MKKGIVGILAAVFFLAMWGPVNASIIDFDDIEGMSVPLTVSTKSPSPEPSGLSVQVSSAFSAYIGNERDKTIELIQQINPD